MPKRKSRPKRPALHDEASPHSRSQRIPLLEPKADKVNPMMQDLRQREELLEAKVRDLEHILKEKERTRKRDRELLAQQARIQKLQDRLEELETIV